MLRGVMVYAAIRFIRSSIIHSHLFLDGTAPSAHFRRNVQTPMPSVEASEHRLQLMKASYLPRMRMKRKTRLVLSGIITTWPLLHLKLISPSPVLRIHCEITLRLHTFTIQLFLGYTPLPYVRLQQNQPFDRHGKTSRACCTKCAYGWGDW